MGALREIQPRMLAPAAIAAFAVALLVVVIASGGGSSSDDSGSERSQPPATRTGERERPAANDATQEGKRTYVVKPGDTLSTIAQATDVPIDRLLTLNPSVDPQSLVRGQRIKLRE